MIHIFYRATSYPEIGNKCRPIYFSLEKCFKNLLNTLNPNETRLTVLFDGDLSNNFIKKYKEKYIFEIIEIKAGSDFKSNTLTFNYIKQKKDIKLNDLIYVLEQDYLHRDWIDAVKYIYEKNINFNMENTYVSLYDHGDKYNRNNPNEKGNEFGMYHDLKSQIYYSPYGYLRSVPNTCGSFIISKELFEKDYEIHTSGEADNTRFHILTKDPYNRKVISFMPGLSTHLHTHYLSPFIPWEAINESTELL